MGILSSELYKQVSAAAEQANVPMSKRGLKRITKQLKEELKGRTGDITIPIFDKVAPYDHVDYKGAALSRKGAAR